jgi:hypothetical protein
MARSEALLALNGYSPPTPIPNTKRLKLMTGKSIDGCDDSSMDDKVMHIDPIAMSAAVRMLPRRLPMLFANIPSSTIPIITPDTTE